MLPERATLGFFALALVFAVAQMFRDRRPSTFELLVPGSFVLLGLTAARHAAVSAMVVAVFTAHALADGAGRRALAVVRALLRRSPGAPGPLERDLGDVEHVLNWLLVVGFASAVFVTIPARDRQQMEEANPWLAWKAIDFIAENRIQAKCFNEYGDGGYFTWRLWPANKAFIDGRADLYPDAFAKRYIEAAGGEESWATTFATSGFDCVVGPRKMPLRQVLLASGTFVEVYRDKDCAVLMRTTHAFARETGRHRLDRPNPAGQGVTTRTPGDS